MPERTELDAVFLRQTTNPVALSWGGHKVVFEEAFVHIKNKAAFVGSYASTMRGIGSQERVELLYKLAQLGQFGRWRRITSLRRQRSLPFAIRLQIVIPGTQARQLVGALVLHVTGVSAYPLEAGWRAAFAQQNSIEIPQIRIGLAFIESLSSLDSIFAIAEDSQGISARGNAQGRQKGRDFSAVIGRFGRTGNMAKRLNALGPFEYLAIDHSIDGHQDNAPAGGTTGIFDARAIGIGNRSFLAQDGACLLNRNLPQSFEDGLPFKRAVDHARSTFPFHKIGTFLCMVFILKGPRTFVNKQ